MRGEGSFFRGGHARARAGKQSRGGGLRLSGEVDIMIIARLQEVFQRRVC